MIVFENSLFKIETKKTSYIIGLKDNILFHLYWGKKISGDANLIDFILCNYEAKQSGKDFTLDEIETSTEALPLEYPTFGSADLRTPALHCKYADGSSVTKLHYRGYEIVKGKPKLQGLPATYVENDYEAETLIIIIYDDVKHLKVELCYTVFYDFDAITRSVKITNEDSNTVRLDKVLSTSIDFQEAGFDMLHLPGAWVRERVPERVPLFKGTQMVESARGASSAFHNPFFALMRKDATELSGDVYGFNLVYSGNFIAGTSVDNFNNTRALIGINPFGFEYLLKENETFQTPEAVLVYSDNGLSGMSRIYHNLYLNRLCRSKFRDTERNVLINNWEATYFNFTEEKLLEIAKIAAETGIDMFVLDDGWFGSRNTDKAGLGDWVVNKTKFPNGLNTLVDKINTLGLKFGLWFEPEMVNPDSDLYRAHPDWCLQTKRRESTLKRTQLVLDLSREDVCNYIIDSLSAVLSSANIEYVKWDMNRNFTEAGSLLLPPESQGEVAHRYILGLYRVLETLTSRFPNILFESCASGGGRYDPGMLYYMPQTWTSDDTDALERLYIQYGTSICYPYRTMGSHVSTVPNHQTGRTTPYKFRGDVAITGQLGYELDMSKLNDDEKAQTAMQVELYKKIGADIHSASLYRLITPINSNYVSNQFITKDNKKVYLFNYCMRSVPNSEYCKIKLADLEEDAIYIDTETNKEYSGSFLVNVGIVFKATSDYISEIKCFEKK